MLETKYNFQFSISSWKLLVKIRDESINVFSDWHLWSLFAIYQICIIFTMLNNNCSMLYTGTEIDISKAAPLKYIIIDIPLKSSSNNWMFGNSSSHKGLVEVWNNLPEETIVNRSVNDFNAKIGTYCCSFMPNSVAKVYRSVISSYIPLSQVL